MGCPTSITIRSPGDPPPNTGTGTGSQGNCNCPPGPMGYQGPQGVPGSGTGTGGPGTQGYQGIPGTNGSVGPQGPAGSGTGSGSQGPQGVAGSNGGVGSQGNSGANGSAGPQGNAGSNGGVGPQGSTGAQGPTAADDVYTNSTPTPTTIGGIPAGSTFSTQTVQQMFNQLLYPYQAPAFTSFSINGQSNPVEVGTTVSGLETFVWGTSNSSNVQSNSVSIADTTAGTVLGSGLANSGSATVNIGSVQKTSQNSNTWTISATNTKSASLSATYTISWFWKTFYGTSSNATLAASDIQALSNNLLTNGYARTYSYPGGGYKYLCYPTSLSTAVSFKDASNNLNIAMADNTDDSSYSNTANGLYYALVSVTNSLSQTIQYRVYRTKNILGGSINIVVA